MLLFQSKVGSMWLLFQCQVGLLYDEVSLHNVLDMIADWTPEDRQNLRNKVMKNNTTKHLCLWEKSNASKCGRWPSLLI